ncbi:MAG: efflux RND transporter periplasmic adaptor subunit [Candidatus Doudnabacteria bacterium]|nr:efflux RND transporter periplasmic adaptor subunit [Candidatus Doudnabacteria bacterium]
MNIRGFFTKKKIIWTVIILLVVLPIAYNILKPKDNSANIVTDVVKKQDIKYTVLATGQVVSETDLNLSFKTSGIVQQVRVKEGDKVKAGQILASLDQKDQLASLTSARGALSSAQANYNKVLSGASNEEISVAQVTLDNAKSSLDNTIKQQQVLVDSAYKALMNSGLSAIAGSGNTGSVTSTVSGTYTGKDQGVYKISIYSTGNGLRFQVNGLETGDGLVDVTPQPIGTKGLFIQFSSTSVPTNNSWTITIPNTQSSSYVTAYNAYNSALETQRSAVSAAQNAVSSAQASLDLKKAQARPADLEAAQAQILSAQGQVLAAQSAFDNTMIKAPADGTITSVDVKVGELASALKEVVILQDVGNLHVEANISEANIASLKPDQSVDITLDALGPDRHFTGKVQTVNPGATVVSGVVNYKVTASVDNIPEVKPGMTANMTVLVAEKKNVLAMPLRGIISKDGKKYVRVITDSKKKTYNEVEVTTGLEADEGLVEILSGLNDGQEVVTYIKQ